jgi:hypothetical protein
MTVVPAGLRTNFNVLPPGDIRNYIVSLAEDDALLTGLSASIHFRW